MEVEEIQTQAPSSKFPRLIGNGGRSDSVKIGQDYPDAEEDGNKLNRLRGWHNHSRIIRVSRASGGKDRHSKVLTSKGLRDRRVRLSVSTAIQFYDIQDRLGYDQPSKAVEWLIKAASEAIAELPSLKNSFPDTPKQLSDEKRASDGTEHGFDSADVHELDDHDPNDPSYQHQHSQQQHMSMSKSACSSTSETSKGSGLSLSRSEIRVNRVKKSRERARERTAKEKEKETTTTAATSTQPQPHQQPSLTPISQSSFTELLTGPGPQNSGARSHWMASSTPMDYFSAGQLLSRSHQQAGFLGQIQLPSQVMSLPPFTISGENSNSNNHHHHHQELQHFSVVPDHINLIPVTSHSPASEYNLNFTISPSSSSSSGLAGFNRGTLQSNSNTPSLLPQLQRFSSSSSSAVDGSNNMPFFMAPVDNHNNHHQQQLHIGQFSSGLQLCYGDGTRHNADHKGKSKN